MFIIQTWSRAFARVVAIGGFFKNHPHSYRESEHGEIKFTVPTWIVDDKVPQCAYR